MTGPIIFGSVDLLRRLRKLINPKMQDTPNPHKNLLVRRLIAEKLITAADFTAFCLDHFPHVQRRYNDNMDRLARENLLLEMVESEHLISALNKNKNPPQKKKSVRSQIIIVASISISLVMLLFLGYLIQSYYNFSDRAKAQIIDISKKVRESDAENHETPKPERTGSDYSGFDIINKGQVTTKDNSPVSIQGDSSQRIKNEGTISTGNGSPVHIGGTKN